MPRRVKQGTLVLAHNRPLALESVIEVGTGKRRVALAGKTARLLIQRRREIIGHIKSTRDPAYGFNRGFGHNVKLAVAGDMAAELQANLIVSHACCLGPPIDPEIVRMTMLLRAQSLARGHSGIRPIVIETILKCLNAGVIPVVPRFGSVSASGDLAPLSHIALGLMGLGKAHYKGRVVRAAAALRAAGIKPLRLEAKEGLALNNGAQYSNAIGIYGWNQFNLFLKTACLATAMSAQVMLGADTPFREDLHALRPHPGAVKVAKRIYGWMRRSPIRNAHRPYPIDGEIQDPYNLRCAAQILGTCEELLERARKTFTTEANSVTDNPVLLPRKTGGKKSFTEIVSGGHFHGMPAAIDLHGLLQAGGIIAALTNARCQRYVDENRNKGLGADLKWPGPTDDPEARKRQTVWSGLMIPEYVSAGLTNYIWGASMPTHLMSISTDAGQEDHVSMAANLGLRVLDILPRVADILALEFVFIGQAAAIRKKMDYIPSRIADPDGGHSISRYGWKKSERFLNEIGEKTLKIIYSAFPPLTRDRYMAEQIAALSLLVQKGKLLAYESAKK